MAGRPCPHYARLRSWSRATFHASFDGIDWKFRDGVRAYAERHEWSEPRHGRAGYLPSRRRPRTALFGSTHRRGGKTCCDVCCIQCRSMWSGFVFSMHLSVICCLRNWGKDYSAISHEHLRICAGKTRMKMESVLPNAPNWKNDNVATKRCYRLQKGGCGEPCL